MIDRDSVLDEEVDERLMEFRGVLKDVFSSHGMRSLHSDSVEKAKWPGLNLLRQVSRRIGIRLRPMTKSAGYERGTGKKIVKRF